MQKKMKEMEKKAKKMAKDLMKKAMNCWAAAKKLFKKPQPNQYSKKK